jgi:hypothetical protein
MSALPDDTMSRIVRLGAGAGFAGDRLEPAVDLAERGQLDYLVFECLAERTIALAQQARQRNPAVGYDPLLEERMAAVLPACRRNGVRIVTNMGAAHPLAAAEAIRHVAGSLGLDGLLVAAVTGDDVLDAARDADLVLDDGRSIAMLGQQLVSVNAYLGAAPIVEALAAGADVVITGRVSDAALFMAPLIHEFGWAMDDWDRLGRGAIVGHLLECAGQVTGGYFADPGACDVPGLAGLGFPIGEVDATGDVVLTKLPGTGGSVTTATVTQQLLYEVHDPARYLQPDVTADLTQVRIMEDGPDRIRVTGGRGAPPNDQLKLSVGYGDGFIGEGQISYAGVNALARAELAGAVVRERLLAAGLPENALRIDRIGVDALHGTRLSQGAEPYEVRLRVAGHAANLAGAERIGREIEALYTNGPAGGGGVRRSAHPVLAIASAYLSRERARASVTMMEPA